MDKIIMKPEKILLMLVFLYAAGIGHAQTNIRDVDFKNFTYSAYCIGEETQQVTVKDGSFSEEKQEDGYVDRFDFRVFGTAYGDLNGDRSEEAVVLTVCNTGGTGNFSEGFVYGIRKGKPAILAHIPGGDRAYGGLRSATVENGVLVVESNDVGELGGACCPEYVITTRYKLVGGKIVKLGTPSRRALVPTERLTFARGTSGKTFKVRIPADGAKRFVVGARAGQRLTASVGSDQASLRLMEDAEVTEGINNFLAVLPKSGDYTIEVSNNSGKAIEITVNVKIN